VPEAQGWDNENDELFALTELLLPAAQSRLDGTFRDSDALDTKALGTLALDAAAIAVLVTVHDAVNRLWWIPTISLAAGGGLLIAAMWPRRFDFGPELRQFYESMSGSTRLEASRQMLAEVLKAVEANIKPGKSVLYWIGLALFVVSLLGCIPIALVRPS
jgi:hypothetical protein